MDLAGFVWGVGTVLGKRRSSQADSYTVKAGDTLSDIADHLGIQGGW